MNIVHRPRVTEILKRLERDLTRPEDGYRYSFGEGGRFEVGVANCRESRERAWSLVYRAYVEKGYMSPSDCPMRILLQDALPGTTTFYVNEPAGRAAGATLTMIPDSQLGLPMDGLYRKELDALRAAGRKPCEIAKLVACVDEKPGMEMLLHLFKLAYLTARRLEDCTDFVITVNPRHEKYYRRLLFFQSIGETRSYDSVNGAPAVPLRLDLLKAEELYREAFGAGSGRQNLFAFFVSDDEPQILSWLVRERAPMSASEMRYFLAERTDLFERASASERELLQDCCPAVELETAELSGANAAGGAA